MARFLALDWDYQQVQVVSATVKHKSLTIDRAATWQDEQNPNVADAEALGKRLRDRLKAEGFAPAPVLACIGRDRLILKEISIPAVGAAEEAAVVRFQAVKELSHAPEEVVIDYLPVNGVGANGERPILVFILRRELLLAYQGLCKAAGLTLAGLAPRGVGTAGAVKFLDRRGPSEAEGVKAVVASADRWAEFAVVNDGKMLFARAMSSPSASLETALAGEIRRNLSVYAAQAPRAPVKALYLAGTAAHDALRDILAKQLEIPIQFFDPFSGQSKVDAPAGKHGAFVGAVGLLAAQAEQRTLPINFLKPKQPQVQRDPHKWRNVAAAAVAAAALLGGGLYGYTRIAARDRDIDHLNVQKALLDNQLLQLEDDAERIKKIGEWTAGSVVWLDELYDLTDRFPSGNNLRLTDFQGVTRTKGKDKHVVDATLKGVVTDEDQPYNALIARIQEDGHYSVKGGRNLKRNTAGIERQTFRRQFETQLEIDPRSPDEYIRQLLAEPPPRNRGRDNPDQMIGFGFGEGAQ